MDGAAYDGGGGVVSMVGLSGQSSFELPGKPCLVQLCLASVTGSSDSWIGNDGAARGDGRTRQRTKTFPLVGAERIESFV